MTLVLLVAGFVAPVLWFYFGWAWWLLPVYLPAIVAYVGPFLLVVLLFFVWVMTLGDGNG